MLFPEFKPTNRDRPAPITSLEINQTLAGAQSRPGEKLPAALVPLKSSPPKLKRKQTCTDAMIEACRVAVQQVVHNWEVVLRSDDPEGPHQMRVGLRRLRSALKAFRPYIEHETLREVDRHARNLGRVLSELRDADVLAADIVDAVLANPERHSDLLSLKAVLARDLVGHRQRVRDELTTDKWIAFRVRLLELPETVARLSSQSDGRRDRSDLRSLAGLALAKHWRRVAKAGRQLDRLTIAERHELRKELKVLRYSAELFSSLYPQKIVRQFLAKLRRLQDAFGYLNDVALAEKLTSINQGSAIRTPDMQRAVGYVIGWHTAHAQVAWQEIGEEWREFARAPKFWSHR